MLPYRAPGTDIVVNGKKCLNLGTFNFLGFAGNQSVKVSCVCAFVRACGYVCVSLWQRCLLGKQIPNFPCFI